MGYYQCRFKMNKKANALPILIFIGLLILIVIIGMIVSFSVVVVDWSADEVVPVFSDLGVIGSTNFTEVAELTIAPVNSFVQSLGWIVGIIYMISLIVMIALAFAFRNFGSPWLIGLFFLLVIIIIMTSILLSNMYEDFYADTGDVGSRLREQTILSFFILESPAILAVIAFISGAIMFTGNREEGGV